MQAYGTVTTLGARYGVASPDAIVVNLLAANGRIGRVLGNYGIHELHRARSIIECHLMGSKGSSLARYPDLRLTRHDDRGVEIEEDFEPALGGYYHRHELRGMHYGEFCNLVDSFARAILNDEPNFPDLEEGLATVRVMDAVVESLRTGQPQSV